MIKTPLSTVIGGAFWTPKATIVGSASKTFNQIIESLFANNEQGLWLDFSDKSQMYQDSSGTVPVTAVSQSIGKVLDKSGNGNHAAQTASSRRPLFQADGAFFDGVDDFFKNRWTG